VNQQTLKDTTFHQPGRYWKQKNNSVISFSGAIVHIDNAEISNESLRQKINLQGPAFLRFSVEAGGDEITRGDKSWAGGSAVIILRSKEGRNLGQHSVVALKQASQMRQYSKTFYVNSEVDSLVASLRLLDARGRFSARNPELSILAEMPKYKAAKLIFIFYWVSVAALLTVCLVRILPLKVFVWTSSLLSLVVFSVIVPGELISEFNSGIFAILPDRLASAVSAMSSFFFGVFDPAAPSAGISKIGHFAIFFLIGVLTGKAFRSIGVAFGIGMVVVLAVVTEALQTLVYDRSTSLRDVYIDISGGLSGLMIGVLCMVLLEKYARRQRPL
jgi:VanZ family protein